MALPEVKIDVNVNLTVDEKALGRALHIVEMWLEDHPDKTIVIEEEEGLRVCLIADEVKGQEAELPGPWKRVEDELPTRSGYYLCIMNGGILEGSKGIMGFDSDFGYFYSGIPAKPLTNVVYWMELPKGPKEEANGEEQGE